MRHFLVTPAVVVINMSLLAQSSAPSDHKASEDLASGPCIVTGRVVAAANGSPLKSARVALIPEHSRSHNQIYAATSDVDGRFILKDIPPGRYRFFATHTGFVEQHYKAGNSDTGPLLSLRAREKVSDALFRMTAAAVITGRVSNEDGDAMPRIQIVALRRPNEEETEDEPPLPSRKMQIQAVSSAQSDDRGQYRIFGLKPGEYYIRAEDSFEPSGNVIGEDFWLTQELGSEYASVYYPGVTQVSQAQAIPIKAGEEVQADVLMHRVKTVEVAGHVIGANGPAADAFVRLEPVEGNDSGFDRQDTTDEKGSFRLRNIPEGSYFLTVYKRGDGSRVYESRARQKIEVTGDNIDSLTISLGGGATIQGRVKVDGPSSIALDRIRVSLMPVDEDGQLGGHSEVKKDGTFEMTSVHDANYAVSVWGLEHDAYIKSVRCGPDDVLEKGLQVEGNSPGNIEVVISSNSAELEGSVSDDDGVVIGAQVRVAPDPVTPYNRLRLNRTITDQLGNFSLTGLAPGKYRVSARIPASSGSSSYNSDPQPVTLSEHDHQSIQLKLVKPQQ
jgi:protocatechuate 3,4-dioxygenase beta subunit